MLGIEANAVRVHLHHARAKVRARIGLRKVWQPKLYVPNCSIFANMEQPNQAPGLLVRIMRETVPQVTSAGRWALPYRSDRGLRVRGCRSTLRWLLWQR
jgi:hypothetical protein